jgi:hypothetical protein
MFLDREEVKFLTGYLRAADQIKWLRNNKVAFMVNAAGYPIVSKTTVQRMLGDGDVHLTSSEPNWGALTA